MDTNPITTTQLVDTNRRRSRRIRTAVVAAVTAAGLAGAACGTLEDAARTRRPDSKTAAATTPEASDTTGTDAPGSAGDGTARAAGIDQAVPKAKRSTRSPRSDLGDGNGSSAQQAQTMDQFMTSVMRNVDSFWSTTFVSAGQPEPWVDVKFPTTGESIYSECTPHESHDRSAFYCRLDDQIVISQQLAFDLWNGAMVGPGGKTLDTAPGDFAVAYVVAHEYAHSLQTELDVPVSLPVYKTELHADCWAGVWANSAYYQGILDGDDIDQGITAASFFGDTDFGDAAGHHGTPEERVTAFMTGYDSGRPAACGTYLS